MSFDTFLQFPKGEIKGEATADKLKDAIEIFSFSWGASAPVHIASGHQGAATGKVNISSFSVMKRTDSASAALFLNCCKGTHLDSLVVHIRKQTGEGGQQDFLTYTFSGVFVESIQWSGSRGGDDTPTESVSFAFRKVEITYKKQAADGKLSAAGDVTWDISKTANK